MLGLLLLLLLLIIWFLLFLAMEITVAEFEENLEGLQNIYPDMEREVLKDLLTKAGGTLEKAIDLYTAQSIRF